MRHGNSAIRGHGRILNSSRGIAVLALSVTRDARVVSSQHHHQLTLDAEFFGSSSSKIGPYKLSGWRSWNWSKV